jgi:hypothetical protein
MPEPNRIAGYMVSVDLLLGGSDAFKHLAEELAAAQERWQAIHGAPAGGLTCSTTQSPQVA